MRGLAELMRELYEELTGEAPRSPLEDISGEAFYGAGYEDGDRERPDVGRMRALGWAPRHGLRETVRETMAYYLRAAGRAVVA